MRAKNSQNTSFLAVEDIQCLPRIGFASLHNMG